MRLLPSLASLLFLFTSTTAVYAQSCGNITLTSQAEVDAFECTSVSRLTIQGDDITDLSPLSILVEVIDGLSIVGNSTLNSLEGLVGSELNLGAWKYCGCITISNNPSLESLSGLENISFRVSSGKKIVTIENNGALTSLEGLPDLGLYPNIGLIIKDQDSWTSIDGLEISAPTIGRLELLGNDSLMSLDALEGALEGQVDRIYLSSNPMISSLVGLEGVTSVSSLDFLEGLTISNMDGLLSLEGLGGITRSDQVVIRWNSSLSSLTGLEGLAEVDQLVIWDNDSLLSLEGLSGLEEAGGCFGCIAVSIRDNDALESLSGLENLTHVRYGIYTETGLEIEENPELSSCSCGLSGLISGDPATFSGVDDDVVISNNDPQGLCTSPEVVLATPCEPVANEDESVTPQKLELEVYPNPVARVATLRYALPEAGPVRLAVYDLLGREVAVLTDGVQPIGRHEARLSGLVAGTYVVRLEVGQEVRTQRVTVLR